MLTDGICSMSTERFDVVILGGGNAGIGVTGPVRRAGMSVAMIESHDLGGTCPNRGCTPKKVLVMRCTKSSAPASTISRSANRNSTGPH
jgi:pyruvate/2-oxoglutarate dehydrogenase complex dihydrolipoamide dehydrogenase (E3) component